MYIFRREHCTYFCVSYCIEMLEIQRVIEQFRENYINNQHYNERVKNIFKLLILGREVYK